VVSINLKVFPLLIVRFVAGGLDVSRRGQMEVCFPCEGFDGTMEDIAAMFDMLMTKCNKPHLFIEGHQDDPCSDPEVPNGTIVLWKIKENERKYVLYRKRDHCFLEGIFGKLTGAQMFCALRAVNGFMYHIFDGLIQDLGEGAINTEKPRSKAKRA